MRWWCLNDAKRRRLRASLGIMSSSGLNFQSKFTTREKCTTLSCMHTHPLKCLRKIVWWKGGFWKHPRIRTWLKYHRLWKLLLIFSQKGSRSWLSSHRTSSGGVASFANAWKPQTKKLCLTCLVRKIYLKKNLTKNFTGVKPQSTNNTKATITSETFCKKYAFH